MDRLAGIATRIQYDLHGSVDDVKADLEDLLQDAMYWREAVKNASEWNDAGASAGTAFECGFCKQYHESEEAAFVKHDHKPDCPWLLAQVCE
jgi:hypothetical protein